MLGIGGFAAVYRARHALTGEMVAVKVLRRRTEEQPEMTSRLIAEARAMSAVRDPHVVRVLDAGVAETGEPFVVMELEQGQSLEDLLTERPVAAARAVSIAVQMLEGLAAVHAKGIVHRDVKPSNVLISQRENGDFVRLLDFGISKVPESGVMTLPGSSMGTPGYMAPELFGDAAGADGRADLYGVAATLYFTLSGRMPFDARNYEDLVVQVRTQRAPPLASFAPNMPPSLCEAVDRGLARDRDARWPDAHEFARALRGAIAGVALAPTPPTHVSAPPLARTTTRTSPSWLGWALGACVAIVAVALLAAGTLWLMRSRSDAAAPVASAAASTFATTTAPPEPAESAADHPPPNLPASAPPPVHATASAQASVAPSVHPTAPSGKSRVVFDPPHVLGQMSYAAITALAARATPQASQCAVRAHMVVKTNLFVHPTAITLVQAAEDNKGDVAVAECVGHAFQDASRSGFDPQGSGIVTVTATLDPN